MSIVEHEQIKNEVRIGWIFEALSHAEQAIEDLFSFLMLSKNIDTFVKNVVNYNATDVKRYIWNFKTNDPSKFLGEFFLPWIAKQHLQKNIDHVTFYAIEEPEAHLHPHQQRKLSAYIQNSFDEQILITTHSPHIASKFEPASIVRLYSENKYSFASCGGCSELLKSVFDNFGYRLNALSAETFFSDGVFLVEGTSEVLFYTALARELKLDLDRHNISILSVEGVGFKPYVAICNKYLHPIKDKYGIVRNNQVAILCRSNSTAFKVGENLSTPYKIFEETVLDRDNSEWGRFFRDLISARFDESVFAVDYAEQLFSEELEPQKYRKALALCQSIFSNSFEEFCNAEDKIKELAGLVYAQKETKVALNNLHSVISDPHQLKNYVPARENELNIMTLHKSKGLEFNIVFHMDMYKWIIPNEYGDESSVQQDLNLHYVGLTRAKDACYIMNGTARFRSKKNDYIFAEPSSFLSKPGLAERRKDVRWEM